MKKEVRWMVILIVAAVIKIFQVPSGFAISWRVDQHTHRGVALSNVIFWALLIMVAVLILIELAHRWRGGMRR